MSHNLDINNGEASFVSARTDAWHGLGVTLPESFTAEEALRHGKLADWNIRKQPMFTLDESGTHVAVPDRHAVVRDNPVIDGQIDVLGDVGNAYRIVQNEDLTGLLDTLVDQSGAHYETAGAIDGGRKVFVTMKLPNHISVGGVDKVDTYLAAMTGHDGSTSTNFMVTPVRIVCQNTLNLAFNRASHQFRVRHTVGAHRILAQQAREALDFTFDYLDGFQQQAQQLIDTTLTDSTFEQLVDREFGPGEDAAKATITRFEAKQQQIMDLYHNAQTQDGIRGTAWAGLNALTEWADHFSPVRGAEDDAASRHRKALLDPSWKNRALELMLLA